MTEKKSDESVLLSLRGMSKAEMALRLVESRLVQQVIVALLAFAFVGWLVAGPLSDYSERLDARMAGRDELLRELVANLRASVARDEENTKMFLQVLQRLETGIEVLQERVRN